VATHSSTLSSSIVHPSSWFSSLSFVPYSLQITNKTALIVERRRHPLLDAVLRNFAFYLVRTLVYAAFRSDESLVR
jgi:hypothetical protein